MKSFLRPGRVWGVALFLLAVLGAAGCDTYSYFDIHVTLTDAFDTPTRAMINTCHVFVTGAATSDATLNKCSPPAANDVGTFDYSTFASSGTVTFTLKAYSGAGEVTEIGEGKVSVPIASGSTAKGELTVDYTGPAKP
ncbi:MAG TPA: hypothetical protein VH374_15800 [Polyangia bacterium]|jgi:hypothetical protein|nr:hypothetical protein [Polyangia bacterium]